MAVKPSVVHRYCVIFCRDNFEESKKLPAACVELIYIDPPFNSNRNYEVFWGETKEKRSSKTILPSVATFVFADTAHYLGKIESSSTQAQAHKLSERNGALSRGGAPAPA
jgi:16S rRNA G966 N2-methylase RsmD